MSGECIRRNSSSRKGNIRNELGMNHLDTPSRPRPAGVTKATASRDLEAMTKVGVLRKVGRTGKGTYYTLDGPGLTKGSNRPAAPEENSPETGQKGTKGT